MSEPKWVPVYRVIEALGELDEAERRILQDFGQHLRERDRAMRSHMRRTFGWPLFEVAQFWLSVKLLLSLPPGTMNPRRTRGIAFASVLLVIATGIAGGLVASQWIASSTAELAILGLYTVGIIIGMLVSLLWIGNPPTFLEPRKLIATLVNGPLLGATVYSIYLAFGNFIPGWAAIALTAVMFSLPMVKLPRFMRKLRFRRR